jgi:phenylacetate-CoA ligase
MHIIPPVDAKERKEFIEYLKNANSDELLQMCEGGALEAFHRAAERIPAYAKHLQKSGVNPAQVKTIADFHRLVPVLNKHNTFHIYDIDEMCLDGNLENVKSILTSSGHSGVFSFGVNTVQNLQNSARSIDLGLEYIFGVDEKRTLLINCLPMGVKVHTNTVVLAETSVRDDMVLAVVKKFSPKFDQTIMVGEGSFLKKLVEDGRDAGIDWESLVVHMISGEEGIAENWRDYICSILGTDPTDFDRSFVMSSMGVAELDLNIFHELAETVRIRRLAHQDQKLRYALFGEGVETCPMFFIYYPHRTYLEVVGDPQRGNIIISMLSPEMKIPLIRYDSGDLGRIYTRQQVGDTLKKCGYDAEKLLPEWQLPMIAVFSRGHHVVVQGEKIYPEEIKEAIYKDFNVAAAVTGNFKLSAIKNAVALVEMQLKPGLEPSSDISRRFEDALAAYIKSPIDVRFYAYATFPYAMGVDYERKFVYVD